MQEKFIIKDWVAQEKRYELVGVHGGISSAELSVPLILVDS
jgi:hypothetical protein